MAKKQEGEKGEEGKESQEVQEVTSSPGGASLRLGSQLQANDFRKWRASGPPF